MSVLVSDSEIVVSFNYWTPRISEWQASNVANAFTSGMNSILRSTNGETIEQIDLLGESSFGQLLTWNGNEQSMHDECIHDLVAQQVGTRPDAIAISAWDGEFSYAVLDDLSSKIAQHLVKLGVGPEAMVPLCFEKSAWAIITTLGVLKAGGACVPLNISHPLARTHKIVEDVQAKLILASPAQLAQLQLLKSDAKILAISKSFVDSLPTRQETRAAVTPEATAFIIYTSGSTGLPKGVVQEHRGICTSVKNQGKALGYDSTSRILQFAAYTFDVSIGDIFGALFYGGCICVLSESDRTDDLTGAINKLNANQACLTPTVARTIRSDAVPSIKTLTLGGEPLTAKDMATWSTVVRLINIYGVTETTVWCTTQEISSSEFSNPKNVGKAFSGRTWIVDANDHGKLAPLGSIGELVIDGPALAGGYLNDVQKTTAAFIKDPSWLLKFNIIAGHLRALEQDQRIYKTGDLARYTPNGSIEYIGRKDTQVKVNGQRIELGEIEHHLISHDSIKAGMVILPRIGHCSDRLVTVLSLTHFHEETNQWVNDISLLAPERMKEAKPLLVALRKSLVGRLPFHMVPTIWIVVQTSPLNSSGKLDRVKVSKWVENIDLQTLNEVFDGAEDEEARAPATVAELKLHDILREVFHLPVKQIGMNRSFVSLGGDSVSAMQVVACARAIGIDLKLAEVLQSESLAATAAIIEADEASRKDDDDKPFALTPFQQLHLLIQGGEIPRLHRSFLFRLKRVVEREALDKAVKILVRQHGVLRTRFVKPGEDEPWMQVTSNGVEQSYRLREHDLVNDESLLTILRESHAAINIQDNPMLVVDLLNLEKGGQLLFLAAHKLMVDLSSWQLIVNDLEHAMEYGILISEISLPPQALVKLLEMEAKDISASSHAFKEQLPLTNIEYWDVKQIENSYMETKRTGFNIGIEVTNELFDVSRHAFGAEPVEVMVATLLQSFSQVFTDRNLPTVFIDSESRNSLGSTVNISNMVSAFNTWAPVCVNFSEEQGTIDNLVKWTKDQYRKIPHNGSLYLASRFLSQESTGSFKHQLPAEVVFTYQDGSQSLTNGSWLQIEENPELNKLNYGEETLRAAIFDISVLASADKLEFSVEYNTGQRHANIETWINKWKQSIEQASTALSHIAPEKTLSDFSLMGPLTYQGLNTLRDERLPELGLKSLFDLEDVYPCSPMQQGLLLSQNKVEGTYEIDFMYSVKCSEAGFAVDPSRLLLAWQAVVQRHPILRTVFKESVADEGLYDQIVMKTVSGRANLISCDEDAEVPEFFKSQPSLNHRNASHPPHQVTVLTTSQGSVFMRFEINHAIVDASSMSIILHDMMIAYEGKLPSTAGPLYSEYIKYIQARPIETALNYWATYLANLQPCYFPVSANTSNSSTKELRSVKVPFDFTANTLRNFCRLHGVTPATIIQATWGLVLRSFTGLDDVSFGYLSSGREIQIEGITGLVGPLINMLVCRLEITPAADLVKLVQKVQENYLASLENQHCSLAQIQHRLRLSGQPLFNTLMSIQKGVPSSTSLTLAAPQKSPEIIFKSIDAHDPTEVSPIEFLQRS